LNQTAKVLFLLALVVVGVYVFQSNLKPPSFQLGAQYNLYFDLCRQEDKSAIGGTYLGSLDETGAGHGSEGVFYIGNYQVGYLFWFKGHLVDSLGKGISGAWINVWWFYPLGISASSHQPNHLVDALTDSNGWYGFPSAEYPNGNWGSTIAINPAWNGKTIIIYAELCFVNGSSLKSHHYMLTVGAAPPPTTTTARGTTYISGHVRDQSGNPVKRVQVSAVGPYSTDIVTDDNGYYSLGLSVGEWTITVQDQSQSISISSGEHKTVDFVVGESVETTTTATNTTVTVLTTEGIPTSWVIPPYEGWTQETIVLVFLLIVLFAVIVFALALRSKQQI